MTELHCMQYAFWDDTVIDSETNLKHTWHSFEKETGNPVFTKKYDWEGNIGPYTAYTIQTPEGYRLFYGTYGGKNGDYPVGLAESEDGFNWHRFDQWTDSIDDGAQMNSAYLDEGHLFEGYPYLGISFFRKTETSPYPCIRVKRSKDGMHWETVENSEWVGPSDVLSLIWDERRGCYVLYYKLWKLAGQKTDGSSFCAYFPGFLPSDHGDIFHAEGYAVLPERKWVDVDLVCRSPILGDDGGGGKITKDVQMYRVIARAESRDLLHWSKEEVIITSPTDSADNQTYGMYVRYQPEFQLYTAFLQQFNAISGHIEPLFAWSYDGVHFEIRYDHPLLTVGKEGEWDAGMVLISQNTLPLGTKNCLYYGALAQGHSKPDSEQVGGIGRAWMRRDGYVSVSGELLVTKPVKVLSDRVFFNLCGSAEVEVQTPDGVELLRFTVSGDHPELIPEGVSLKAFYGKELRFIFHLGKAELYSFGFLA